eukprot:CAMPEP_0185270334 /NCGR_PEP_ID=MMETSP1359-20130426/42074_1 /TAXON_ID=552665 /ORGANISM="Bigelowiella longifila, Strain CCMP242" /LENGTH=50 /DNA_ID=CAMNT_0027861843 /DNA_START=8 /DNA_END=160 /DNA_ORIENTATION=+
MHGVAVVDPRFRQPATKFLDSDLMLISLKDFDPSWIELPGSGNATTTTST